MRRRFSNLLGICHLVAACAAVSCSAQDASRAPSAGAASESSGSVGLALTPVAGVTLNNFSYTIVGPNAFSRSGTVDISHSATLSTTVGGLPVGSGYTVTISSTARSS
jgi:hypothetical protein